MSKAVEPATASASTDMSALSVTPFTVLNEGDTNDIDAVWDTLQDGNFWIHKDADTARLSAAVLGLHWVVRGDWSAIQIADAYVLWGRCFN